jgi:hypothetical protein
VLLQERSYFITRKNNTNNKKLITISSPIFLRSNRLIFVNEPTTIVADLTNNYSIFGSLNLISTQSTGKFLDCNNFTDNSQIDAQNITIPSIKKYY